MIDLTILSRDVTRYESLIAAAGIRNLRIVHASDTPSEIVGKDVTVLLSEPDLAAQVIDECANLRWLQSTWAGNAPLIKHRKTNYVLTAARGIFGPAMREYVFAYLLHFSRCVDDFKNKEWSPPPIGTLNGKTLGILGAGDIASALIPVARSFGMQVIGVNRSGKQNNAYDELFTVDDKLTLARESDYIVALLPDTSQTLHMVDRRFIDEMRPHCVFINAGRGATVDDNALIEALNKNRIKAAVLDVFTQEPLPSSHPYWSLPNVIVTQHTAAITRPEDIIKVFAENCRRWNSGKRMRYEIDFDRGY